MSNTQKFIIPIKGMHCKSCEILVEEELKAVRGIKKAVVDHRKDMAEIYYRGGQSPDLQAINSAIEKAGYSVGKEEKKGWISKDKNHYKELGLAALFLLGLYYVLKGLGVTNLDIAPSSEGITVPLVLLVGLVAGVSTCMALVGGLVLGLAARHNELHPEATAMQKFRPHLFFNLGRILSYAFFGGILGLLGSVIQPSSFTLGVITIVVGLVMLTMGLQLIEIFPWANRLKLTLPKSLSRLLGIGGHQKEYSHKNSMIMGALTFFLPCGFTQAMQVFAIATGSFFYGAIVMGLFALGTLPGLLGIGGLTSIVKGAFARKFFKAAGLAVIAFSIFNISNGLGLAGINLAYGQTEKININDPNVTLEKGVQVVRMKELANGYSPNSFTIQKNIPVKWIIDAQAPFSCASYIILPKHNIRRSLSQGENIIEFTPKETGVLRFSCGMGMYTGSFTVVDENGSAGTSAAPVKTAVQPSAAAGAGGCGGGATTASPGGGCGGGGNAGAGGCGGGSGGGCGCGGGKKVIPSIGATVSDSAPTKTAGGNAPTANDGLNNEQVITSDFTVNNDIQPNTFTVKAGKPVKYVINPKEDGVGCMYAIMIPDLYNNPIPLEADRQIVMNFTPSQPGEYDITCGMGVPRGKIVVK